MRTGFVRRIPASVRVQETIAVHIWGATQVPVFHLSLYGRPQSEREFGQILRPLGLDRWSLGPLYKLYWELFTLSLCGSVFVANGGPGRRFHVSTLVPAESVNAAEELAKEIVAYLEG